MIGLPESFIRVKLRFAPPSHPTRTWSLHYTGILDGDLGAGFIQMQGLAEQTLETSLEVCGFTQFLFKGDLNNPREWWYLWQDFLTTHFRVDINPLLKAQKNYQTN